jgi:beta-galactosidase
MVIGTRRSMLPFGSVALLLALGAAVPTASHAQTPAPLRKRILMDAGWRFQMEAPIALTNVAQVTAWRWRADDNGPQDAATLAAPAVDTAGAEWRDAAPGDDVFHGRSGYAWFRTTLPTIPGPHRVLRLKADDNADVYLNGIKLAHHEGWQSEFSVPLDTAWKDEGPNALAILVRNLQGAGGLGSSVAVGSSATNPDPTQPVFNEGGWRTVHLPHDYVVEGTFTPTADPSHGSLPTAPAWYRKSFTLPASAQGKSVWIDFDGVYRDSKVYLNGQLLGEHPSGYTGFRYDISKFAYFDGTSNVLTVHVDPTAQEGWWYEGGGIYRHVWLNIADPLHVAPNGTFVTSEVKDPLHRPSATVTIKTTVTNASEQAQECTVVSEVFGPKGQLVEVIKTPQSVPAGGHVEVAQSAVAPQAALWSIEKPQLYRLHTTLVREQAVDAVDTAFGIRTIRFDKEKGFFLNEKPVKILGTCTHQDFAGVGTAMPDSVLIWRTQQLKAMGSNAVRMSHNPPAPELLDACDRLGMLVMDETRHLGDTEAAKTPRGTSYADLSELTDLILRDRNHPSIIIWSMCNEEPLQGSAEGARIFTAMRDRVRQYDTTRPVSCAMNDSAYHGIALVEDIRGFNYDPGSYARYHPLHPEIPIYGSETASTVATRGVYSWDRFRMGGMTYTGVEAQGWVSAYDVNAPPWAQTAQNSWPQQADAPFVAGGFAWTGFDYKGEPTPFNWPDINSNFGILDECGFPKDVAYYYKAWWTDKPLVHVFPHWNWAGKEGQPIPVWVYSNAARIELIVNDKSLGSKPMPRNGHVEWNVPYAPGSVVAKGYDARGRMVASDKVETTGAAAAIRLTTDRIRLNADGEDVTMVTVAVVDAQGRVVATADNPIHFDVSGKGYVAGVGNGNPSDHDPDKSSNRRAFNGLCMVVVGAKATPGAMQLTATAPGLKSAILALSAK